MGWTYRMMAGHEAEEEGSGTEPIDAAILEQLAPQQLLILRAWFQEELTCREIASAPSISRDDAFARVQAALKTLNEALY